MEIKIGLSECLKHGLLQDSNLFNDSFALIMHSAPDTAKCFEVALRTQELKSNTLLKDPFEKNFGKTLLYGHLHAHSIERFKDLSLPHGISVIWGIAIDLLLVDNLSLYNQLLIIINQSELESEFKKLKTAILADSNFFKHLQKIYNSETKLQHYKSVDKYNIIKLVILAEYENNDRLDFVKVNWRQVEKAIKKLLQDIS